MPTEPTESKLIERVRRPNTDRSTTSMRRVRGSTVTVCLPPWIKPARPMTTRSRPKRKPAKASSLTPWKLWKPMARTSPTTEQPTAAPSCGPTRF